MKRARSSRIIEEPGGITVRPGSADGPDKDQSYQQNLSAGPDHDPNQQDTQSMLGASQMALDDIPRILQAEVTREIRPNAAKYASNKLDKQCDGR